MTTDLYSKWKQVCLASMLMVFLGHDMSAQTPPTYRTLDGTLNNLSYPDFGKAGIPFYRELPAEYADGKNTIVTNRPNPRLLSNKLSDEPEDDHNDRMMAGMFYSWGQFLDHDITRGKGGTESMPIPLPSGESKFSNPIAFTRSAIHPGSGSATARDQSNTTTAWVDASQVYSDNLKDANWLRTFSGGKLKVSAGNLLPFNTLSGEYDSPIDPNAPTMDDTRNRATGQLQKVFVAGDPRASEHPVLTSLHTLLVREHNRICESLKYSGYSDEVTYQKARKEVGALMQVVTFGQWISSLGVNLQSYGGYKSAARPDIMNTFSTAAYRWHTMVENDIIFRNNSCHGVGPVELPLKDVFFNQSIVRKNGIDVLLKGISVHRSYETDLRVNSGLRNNLLGPGMNLDLVSINIQRGRDHGLPNYNTIRNFYTGSAASTFTDIAGNSRTSVSSSSPGSGELIAPLMQSLYGDVNKVDLWVGLYAEPRMSGKSVGKTVDAILRAQLERLRDGDFYYFENDPELTAADKSRIRSTTLKQIIERNTTAGDLQDNVFFVKSCSSSPNEFDDIAKRSCSETPQYEGWSFIGKQGAKSYYKWNGGSANFEDAQELVERLGGRLPQITNATENNYFKTLIPSGSSVYLDLNLIGTQWKYSNTFNASDILINGIVSPYYNWKAGEPNNASGREHRVQMYSDGQWNDLPETALQTVIAEVGCQEDCSPFAKSVVTEYNINNSGWYVGSTVTVNLGANLVLSANPNGAASYKWTGPNGFAQTTTGSGGDILVSTAVSAIHAGTYTVQVQAAIGTCVASKSINVVVNNPCANDIIPPTFTSCPSNINTSYGLLAWNKYVSWATPTATDNCGSVSVVKTSGPSNGSYLSAGYYAVTYTATDAKGNKSYCSFDISVSKTLFLFLQGTESLTMEAKAEPNRTYIEWVSNTGFKTDYFTVEKVNNATGTFEKLETVNSTSKDDSPTHYATYDNNPTEGDNIYRVKVTNQDGSITHSETKTVIFKGLAEVRIFPNPANETVSIDLSSYRNQAVEVYLYNYLGQQRSIIKIDKVENSILELDIANEQSGNYMIRISSKNRRDITKLLTVTH